MSRERADSARQPLSCDLEPFGGSHLDEDADFPSRIVDLVMPSEPDTHALRLTPREAHEGGLQVGAGRWFDLGAEHVWNADYLIHR